MKTPAKPINVPEDAKWLGGDHGGAFVAVHQEPSGGLSLCVYDDQGMLLKNLKTHSRSAVLLNPECWLAWDGDKLLTTNDAAVNPPG